VKEEAKKTQSLSDSWLDCDDIFLIDKNSNTSRTEF